LKQDYYTYAYLRKDNTPYYIGKGKGRRAYCSQRTVPRPTKDRILIFKKNLSEEEAFKHEMYMIHVFGRKNNNTGILRNLTDGGEGVSGLVFSLESRQKMSDKRKLRVTKASTRLKQSEAQRGRKQTQATKEKLSKLMAGRERSEEHCKNLSVARKKNWEDPDYRRKVTDSIRLSKQANPMSEQQKRQLSLKVSAKKWYWNPDTGHCTRLSSSQDVPQGYIPGRKTFNRRRKIQ
jgi:hypothetical protein